MYPKIFGVIDSYVVMVIVGVAIAITLFCLYFRKNVKITKNEIIDLLIVCVATVFVGIIFACLFENVYEWIEKGQIVWTWGMTFYGGLFGGAITFVLMYFLYYKKRHDDIFNHILIIAPGCITSAHCIGRVGCFLAGCCYGKVTDSPLGIVFPNVGIEKRLPTQLFEAIFLLILSIILLIFAFKHICNYTMIIYMMSYAIFRFIIEFFRDDPRGVAFVLSPSQIWCLIIFVVAIPLIFIFKKFIFIKDAKN